MIVGIGLDIVELNRMNAVISGATGQKFIARVLTKQEVACLAQLMARRALEFVAGRFAAKEAVVKALGCGIGAIVGFQDIELLPDRQGKPVCVLSEQALARLGWQERSYRLHVAITHERSMAAATALVEI